MELVSAHITVQMVVGGMSILNDLLSVDGNFRLISWRYFVILEDFCLRYGEVVWYNLYQTAD